MAPRRGGYGSPYKHPSLSTTTGHVHGTTARRFAFLNSTVVDQYFRRFSGHTQVNATDLRTLAYPRRDILEALGRALSAPTTEQDEIDQLVNRHLHSPVRCRPLC